MPILLNRMPYLLVAAVLAAGARAGTAVAAEATDFSKLAQARFVYCAFYKQYQRDPATGDPIMVEGRGDALMHFQNVDARKERALAYYTRMAGRREVVVRQTPKALYFIDNVAGMYLLTSVHSCLDYDERRGLCVTYGATHARVFDAAVLRDPDAVAERIGASAEPGFCDQSFIGLREAAAER